MSYSQNFNSSPNKNIQNKKDTMMQSFLLTSPSKNVNFSNQNIKTKFKDCFYHSKPVKYLCISQNCQSKYFTLCQTPQCKKMHSHPDLKIIQVQKFQQFKRKHLKSISLLQQRIDKYQKQVIQTIIHKLHKDFQLVRNILDTFYVNKAVKKINQENFQALNSKQLAQFIQKSLKLEAKNEEQQSHFGSKEPYDKNQYLQSTFIDVKNYIVQKFNKCDETIKKLTLTTQYKQLTLQNLINVDQKLGNSPNKSMIKKQTFSSKIIQFQQQYQTLIKMLRQNRVTNFNQFKLIYRGSENAFSAQKYHQAVDNKVPLFLICLADTGRKFGAFINCKSSKSNDWISDPTGMSFIYSLDHNQTYRLKPGANFRTKAIFGGHKGPQIGLGCDIYISDSCNQNQLSGANFGASYQLPFGLEYGTKKARSHLAGKQNFAILQYQVYLLV